MLRRTFLRAGEPAFKAGGRVAPVEAVGGVPKFGNIFSGRINPESFNAPPLSQGTTGTYQKKAWGTLRELNSRRSNAFTDPYVKGLIDKCPYFSLCDMVVWGKMDPEFLDPGLVSEEEHQLLLLHSRAYFEKWKKLSSRPQRVTFAPKMYLHYGEHNKLAEIMDYIGVSKEVFDACIAKPHFLDDTALIAMSDKAWETAHLCDQLRDEFTGMTLIDAGVEPEQLDEIFDILHKMRSFVVVRNDLDRLREESIQIAEELKLDEVEMPGDPNCHHEVFEMQFSDAITCYDLYEKLGIEPYNGQIKVYNLFDPSLGLRKTLTLHDEDTYFDYLIHSFNNANVRLHAAEKLSAFESAEVYSQGSLNKAVITVEPITAKEASQGRYF